MRKMKDSGIEWIGEIPEGWKISKVSYFYEVQLGKMLQPQKKSETDTEEKYLCAANVGKNSLSLDTLKTMWFSQTEKHQFDLREGDLLVVEGGDVASCAIIETPVRNLFFQNALHRVRPLHNESVAFLRYWLMTAKSYGYIDLICNKATIAHFSKEKFIALPIPVMPQDIQSKIVSFLDLECKQIDDLLSKSRSSIEEYKKLKQAVITQAVTKGVRGEREMKDSGVEWIGEIPVDWTIQRFARVAEVKSNLVSPDNYLEYPQISPENIEKDSGKLLLPCKTVGEVGVISGNHLFYKGQILYSKIRPKLNKVCIAPFDGLCSADMYPIETNYDTRYIMYCILSNGFFQQVSMITENRVKMPKINQVELSKILVSIPETIAEQKEIADYLDAKCAEIDGLIAKKEQLVKELENYKKSLIYEVVTGKREV